MPISCCVENCSNNAKSQPNLNFYILSYDKQRLRHWLQAIVGLRLMKIEKLWTRLGLLKLDIIVCLNILRQVSGNIPLCII